MDRAPMIVRVILPEDSNARHCGESIDGHLEVTTNGKFAFEIDVSFEGCLTFALFYCIIFTKS
jgi:hypothetical protein